MLITLEQLQQIMPKCTKAAEYIELLNDALRSQNINTPLRIAAFCSQVAVETDELTKWVENLNYSAKGLMATWPKRFPTLEVANKYARQPEKIANYVYANRLGNGNEASGEGWKYRGRGILQTTGKENYKTFGDMIKVDLVAKPELAADAKYAFSIAVAYWNKKNINEAADKGDIVLVSKLVNGGTIGLEDRKRYYNTACQVLKV